MYHLTGSSGTTHDIEWNGKSAQLQLNGAATTVDILSDGDSKCHILLDRRSYSTEILDYNKESKVARVKVNGRVYTITIKDRFDDLLKSLGMENAGVKKVKDVKAPMPGLVLDIMAAAGQTVQKDSPLLILEAMKMENVIKSPAEGVIKKVTAVKGTAVEKNAVLIEFE
jgi:acetyl/propionyl-CoA carboxylase alpha subunit